jgi:hypothetical protein
MEQRCKIEVRYKTEMVRSYELNYAEGAFKKTFTKIGITT